MLMKRSSSVPKVPELELECDESNKGHKEFDYMNLNTLNRTVRGSISSRSSTRSLKQLATAIVNKTTPLLSKSHSMLLSKSSKLNEINILPSSTKNSKNPFKSSCFMTCALGTTLIITFAVWLILNVEFFLSHTEWSEFNRVESRSLPTIGISAKLPVYFESAEMDALNEYLELKHIHYIYPTCLRSTIENDEFLASEYFNSAAVWDEDHSVYWMLTRMTSTKQKIESSRLLLSIYNEDFEKIISDQFLPFRPNENNIYGPEDPRLFTINNEIYFVFQFLNPTQIGVAKLFEIIKPIQNEQSGKLETIDIPTTFDLGTRNKINKRIWNQCRYSGLDEKQWQKNWSPFEYKDSLYFMVKFNPLLIIHCHDLCKSACKIVYDGKYSVDSINKNAVGVVRGGTQLIHIPNNILNPQLNNNKNYDYLVGILHTTWWEDENRKIAHSAKYRGHIVVVRINFDILNQNETKTHHKKSKAQITGNSTKYNVKLEQFKISNNHINNNHLYNDNNYNDYNLNALDKALKSIQALADEDILSESQIEILNDIFQKLALKNIHNVQPSDSDNDGEDDGKSSHIIRVPPRQPKRLDIAEKFRSIRRNVSDIRENIIKSYNFDNRIIHMSRSFTMKICLDHPLLMGGDAGLEKRPCLPVQFWSLIAFPVSIVRIDFIEDKTWISWGIDDAGSVILVVEGFISYLQSGFAAPQGFADLNAHRAVDTFAHHILKHSDSFFGKAHSHKE